jgi:predicted TIM-barrel fold metal-dependent hydrolase
LRSLCELVGPSNILFGIDFPFAPEAIAQASVQGLARFDRFDEAALRLIERDNALALLPKLRERMAMGATTAPAGASGC